MKKIWEYRIEYQHKGDIQTNYHYYNAETAEEAVSYQNEMAEHKNWDLTILKVEKKCPYRNQWVDESSLVDISV